MIDERAAGDTGRETPRIFGQLTLMGPTGELIRGVKVYECRCACGNLDKATIPLLMMGRKTSCGCQNRTKTSASKPELHEVERLRTFVEQDGRPLAEIASAAGLAESLVTEGLAAKRRLTLATTCSLMKALGKHWSDLDEPTTASTVAAPAVAQVPLIAPIPERSPLPQADRGILPSGARPRHLSAILTRNRVEPPSWFQAEESWMAPFQAGDGLVSGGESF